MKDFVLTFGLVFIGYVYLLNYLDKRKRQRTHQEPDKKGRTVLVFSLILFLMGIMALAMGIKP